MNKPVEMLLLPRVTAKTDRLARQLNTYTLLVPKGATKAAVKAQLEADQSVNVVNVRSLNQKGKPARSLSLSQQRRNQRTRLVGKRSDFKKVYVSLKAGQELAAFTDLTGAQPVED